MTGETDKDSNEDKPDDTFTAVSITTVDGGQ